MSHGNSAFEVVVHQDAIDDLMRSYKFVQKHAPNTVAKQIGRLILLAGHMALGPEPEYFLGIPEKAKLRIGCYRKEIEIAENIIRQACLAGRW